MSFERLAAWSGVKRLGRAPDVSDRAVVLVLGGRFVDEILSGTFLVLLPTFRRVFRLSLVELALLSQVLEWVALVVEPPASLLVDLRSRRVLMAFGSGCVAASMLAMGLAPAYVALLIGFAIYGLGSGPLCHTADVLLVESFPADQERAFARGTFVDTAGALIAPLLVAATTGVGLSWRTALVLAGAFGGLYALLVSRTRFPAPPHVHETDSVFVQVRRNLREVLASPAARRWLLFLLAFDVLEAAGALRYVWLTDEVGATQPVVAAYAIGEQLVALVALAVLDRWLARTRPDRLLVAAALAVLVLFPAWLAAPGLIGRVVVGAPLAFVTAMLWPIGKARSLGAVPGRAGAVSAVTALFTLLPITLAFGAFAERVGLTTAMLIVAEAGGLASLVAAWWAGRAGDAPAVGAPVAGPDS